MSFDGVILSPQKEVVRVFYKELWDHADKSQIPQLFHENFTFRGSLRPVLTGHDEFAGYVDMVTGALADYTSDILEMVEEDNKVFGKLRFHGFHRKELLGFPRRAGMCGGTARRSLPSLEARCATCGCSATSTDSWRSSSKHSLVFSVA